MGARRSAYDYPGDDIPMVAGSRQPPEGRDANIGEDKIRTMAAVDGGEPAAAARHRSALS